MVKAISWVSRDLDPQVACTSTSLCLSFPLKKGDSSPRVKSLLFQANGGAWGARKLPGTASVLIMGAWLLSVPVTPGPASTWATQRCGVRFVLDCVVLKKISWSKLQQDRKANTQHPHVPALFPRGHTAIWSMASLAINRLQPKFSSARDIISSAGLARGGNDVSLKVSKALRFCFVTDTPFSL